jgi:hypothetical protein
MSNLKHGYYSTNTTINPDSVMMGNLSVKREIINYMYLIKKVLDRTDTEILPVGALDLVTYLISCVNNGKAFHLLPVEYQQKAMDYSSSRTFIAVQRYVATKSLDSLIKTYSSLNSRK